MDDARLVRVRESVGYLLSDVCRDRGGDLLLGSHGRRSELGKRAALDELLDDVGLAVMVAGVERSRDGAVRNRPRDVRLAAKPLEPLRVRERLGVHALDDTRLLDAPSSGERQEHGPHSAASERPDEDVVAPALGVLDHRVTAPRS